MRRTSFAKHVPQITNEFIWLLVSCEMTTAIVFSFEYGVLRPCPPVFMRNRTKLSLNSVRLTRLWAYERG